MSADRPMCYGPDGNAEVRPALPEHSIQACHFYDRGAIICRCGERALDDRRARQQLRYAEQRTEELAK